MRIIAQNKRFARASRRRGGERGLTLIELVLSLAILTVLTGFVAGGLSMARRSFEADRASRIASGSNAAIQTISTLLASALPSASRTGGILFEGGQETILFSGLSEGRSLRGGPHKFSFRRIGSDLMVDVSAWPTAAGNDVPEPPLTEVRLLSGITRIRFNYFGKTSANQIPGWRPDWVGVAHLPDLVSVWIDFEDPRRNEPAIMVALRQR
jgi:general secretion pathway protein J